MPEPEHTQQAQQAPHRRKRKPRLAIAARIAGAALALCMILAMAFILHSMFQIRAEAENTRQRVLADIIDRQRTILNVDRLLRYGEIVLRGTVDERRRTLVAAQSLAREMTNESP